MYFSNAPFKVSLLAAAIALTGCGGDSSSSSSDDSKDGGTGLPVSGFTISAQGGDSVLGEGGEGGAVSITKTNSASQLTISKEGAVDATYTLPAHETHLGTNGVTITESQTVQLITNEAIPTTGTLYMVPDKARLYKSTGAGAVATADQEVTGLSIPSGVTLTLMGAEGGEGASDSSGITLFVRNDIENNGEIQTVYWLEDPINDSPIKSPYALDVELYAAAYSGAGSIKTAGDAGLYNGQKGGDVEIYAHTIRNGGLINASGASGSHKDNETGSNDGGAGGMIALEAMVFVENTGELRSNGGVPDSENGDEGGMGGNVELAALEVYNSAEISVNHGAGEFVDTNNNAFVRLLAYRTLINTGAISAVGGEANSTDSGDDAGNGGAIRLKLEKGMEFIDGFDGRFVNTGSLNVDGGSVTENSSADAGRGGVIELSVEEVDDYYDGPTTQSEIQVSIAGNLSAKGGSTAKVTKSAGEFGEAGVGGTININVFNHPASTNTVFLAGYDSVSMSGGAGMSGGSAGDFSVTSNTSDDDWGSVPQLAGSVVIDTDVLLKGGSALADSVEASEDLQQGMGGSGGVAHVSVENEGAYLQEGALNLSFSGSIDATGGRSYDMSEKDGSTGGFVRMSAPGNVSVTGSILLNGGSDDHQAESGDSAHEGADAGFMVVNSTAAAVEIDATIEANGGNGTLIGGDAGAVLVVANSAASLAGTIALNGGSAAASEVDAFSDTEGGDAGQVYMLSSAYSSNLSSTIAAQAGTGDEVGEDQVVYVDADCKTENCGVTPEKGGSPIPLDLLDDF